MRGILVLLLVVGALLVVVDRVGVAVAEDRVAESIAQQAGLAAPPTVDVVGFPILDDALRGRYDEVRVAFDAEALGQPEGTRADVVLRGAEVPLSELLGTVERVPVQRLEGTATVTYELLAAELGGDTRLERDGNGLRLTRTVELLGQQVPLTASGTVTLEGADLVVDVEDAAGAGVELPDLVVDQAGDLLDLRYTVPPLPYGLQLSAVRPAEDGVVIDLEATGTVLEAVPE